MEAGTTQCGVRVELNSPYAAAPGSVKVGFAISEKLPVLAVVKVFLPTVTGTAGPFVFNTGGASKLVGLVTAGGDEQVAPLHGMGAPDIVLQSVSGGTMATITMGEIRQPTLKDTEAGFEMNITNVRNPYAGPIHGNATVWLLRTNGSIWYQEDVAMPIMISGPLTANRVKFDLTRAEAGVESDVTVKLKTWGVIPLNGYISITLPDGFILSAGSTVALKQLNFGDSNAIYVSSVNEVGNNITILMAGSMGNTLSDLKPHPPSSNLAFSFTLTRVRTPYSGTSGTFKLQSFTGDGLVIDDGSFIAGVQVGKGKLRDVFVTSTDDAARKETDMTFIFGTSGTVPGDGKILIIMPFGYYMPSPTLLAYNGLGRTGTPQLSSSGLILTIQLGGGHVNATSTTSQSFNAGAVLDATDGVSFTIGGIINPGAGSTASYIIRTTFPDATKIIDQEEVPGMGISTGMFPWRSVSVGETRSGQPTTVRISFSTTGFVPDNTLVLLGVPNGLGLSLPIPT